MAATDSRRAARLEWALALAAAAASIGVMCWVGRSTWFRMDVWDFLVRRPAGSLESWIRPHAGHFQWVAVGLHRLLYGAVKLDFWPWYYLPALLGHVALSLLLWRALLKRGTGRGVAFAAFLVILFLGVSAFLTSIAVGGLLVLALLSWVAQRLDSDAAPSRWARAWVTVALLIMATSSSLGVAGVVGCFLALALTRALRRWWWCFLPAVAAYGAWYVLRGAGSSQGNVQWRHLGRVPGDALRLLGNATGRLFGWGGGGAALGAVVAAALVSGVAWLAWKRRLGRWDLAFAVSLGTYLLMVVLVRGTSGRPLDIARYAYPLVLLAVPLVVPHLRLTERVPAGARIAVLLLVGGGLLGVNAWERVVETDLIVREAAVGRVAIESVGGVLAAGEPAIATVRLKNDLRMGTAGLLTVADVRDLVADGWAPAPQQGWTELDRIRGLLRVFPAEGSEAVSPPPLALPQAGPGGCVELRPGGSRRFAVAAAGEFSLEPVSRRWAGAVEVVWRDDSGDFPQRFVVSEPLVLMVAGPPPGGAFLSVSNLGERRVTLCGVAASEG